MTQRFWIDTSILVRLVTGEPPRVFDEAAAAVTRMVEREHATLFVSNMVIGETYIALQRHYAVSKPDAKAALSSVMTNGLAANRGCGFAGSLDCVAVQRQKPSDTHA